jgi:hypothetical protein
MEGSHANTGLCRLTRPLTADDPELLSTFPVWRLSFFAEEDNSGRVDAVGCVGATRHAYRCVGATRHAYRCVGATRHAYATEEDHYKSLLMRVQLTVPILTLMHNPLIISKLAHHFAPKHMQVLSHPDFLKRSKTTLEELNHIPLIDDLPLKPFTNLRVISGIKSGNFSLKALPEESLEDLHIIAKYPGEMFLSGGKSMNIMHVALKDNNVYNFASP